jgi:hypothetical protein
MGFVRKNFKFRFLVLGKLGLLQEWSKMDPEPEVPTLLYIGRRGRVTERAITLTD